MIKDAEYWRHVASIVAAAPPLTPEQADRIASLLRPRPEDAAQAA